MIEQSSHSAVTEPRTQKGRGTVGSRLAVLVLVALAGSVCGCLRRSGEPLAIGATTQERRQVQALVYLLHNYTRSMSPRHNEQWKQTIEQLVQIGAPAVPELCDVLDRTEHDVTMQSVAYTLRAIGDARAVPALIRALPKTATRGSNPLANDPDLLVAAIDPSREGNDRYPLFLYGRSAHEITAALEHLTGHSEGSEHLVAAATRNPDDVLAVRDRRKQTAERWVQWWSTNGDAVLSSTAVAAAPVEPDDTKVSVAAATPGQVPTAPSVVAPPHPRPKPAQAAVAPVVTPQLAHRAPEPLVLKGVCVDRTGQPVGGAKIACYRADYLSRRATLLAQSSADRLGRFELPHVPPLRAVDRNWSYVVLAQDGLHGRAWAMVRNEASGKRAVQLKLGPRASVKGRLLNADGRALQGVRVWVRQIVPAVGVDRESTMSQWFNASAPLPGWETTTDEQGVFQIESLCEGERVGLEIVHSEHGRRMVDVGVGAASTILFSADGTARVQIDRDTALARTGSATDRPMVNREEAASIAAVATPPTTDVERPADGGSLLREVPARVPAVATPQTTIKPASPVAIVPARAEPVAPVRPEQPARAETASKPVPAVNDGGTSRTRRGRATEADQHSGWGSPVQGLRCRWLPLESAVESGSTPTITLEVQNVAGQRLYWGCRRGITWLIPLPKSQLGFEAPLFEVELGSGTRIATAGELRANLKVHRRGARDDEPVPGFYSMESGSTLRLVTKYPRPLSGGRSIKVRAHLARYYQLGWNLDTRQVIMTCPPLAVRVAGSK